MPPIPIRGLGALGALPDLNPFDTPTNAISQARNIKFQRGSLRTSPVFKELKNPVTFTADPVHLFYEVEEGVQGIPVVVTADGRIKEVANGVLTDVAPTAGIGTINRYVTSTNLGGVSFVNHADAVPVFRSPSAAKYANLTGWDAADRAGSIRAYKDFLVAINVSKGATKYPGMVKWSDATQAGQPPANWDTAAPASLAGENVLNDLKGFLIDSVPLNNSMILYGSSQVYRMDFIGAPLVFAFDRVFDDFGLVAANCVASVDMKHYAFGVNDIVVHDGTSKKSIADNRVKQRVYSRLSVESRDRCFVHHNQNTSEIMFCYPVRGDGVAIDLKNTTGCNEAAVYNYAEDTWSFVDLPGVVSMVYASLPNLLTWGELPNWHRVGGSWLSMEGKPTTLPLCAVSGTNPSDGVLLFYDDLKDGFIPNEVNLSYLYDGYVEIGLKDLDELGATLLSHKTIRSIHPQVSVLDEGQHILIEAGAARHPRAEPDLSTPMKFLPWTQSKVDTKVSSKYVIIRFIIPAGVWAEISGFDLDLVILSQR